MTAPPPVEHEDFDALAAGWALDALEPDDLAAFERHRSDGCTRCDDEVASMLALAAELAYALPQSDPSPELRGRLLAAASPTARPVLQLVRTDADEQPGSRSGRHRAPGRSRWTSGLVAAGLAVVVGVGGWQVGSRVHGSAPPVTAAADRVATLAPPKGGSPVATVLLGTGQATVVTSTLSPSAAGRSYVLWGLPAGGGAAEALGSFDATGTGSHSYRVVLRHPGGTYESLALSDERAGTLPAAPSRTLALGALTH